MYQRLTSENVLTYVCSFFFCTRRLLPLLLLCQLIAFASFAQIKADALIEDSLVEYGSVIIPYKTEAEALTFDPASSTWVRELTWSKAVKQVKTAAGNTATASVYTTSVETPAQWLGKEQFLVILSPKTSFTIEVNGYRKKLASPGVNTQIRITPLLKAEGGATTIKVTSDKDTGDIDALAYKFLLMATPDVRFATSRVRVFNTYPENYRGLNWSYRFKMKNYAQSPRYTSFFRKEEKVRDFSGKVVTQIIADSTEHGNIEPIRDYYDFFYVNREVYSYKWSAESPNLFLVISGHFSSRYDASEVISERVGLRMSEIKAGELRIDNIPVWFKAVAYTHPLLEAPVPSKEKLRDYVIKLKQHHINTIQVFGLPVNNDLYDLADEFGLYLIQYLNTDKERISEGEMGSHIWFMQRLSMLYQLRNRPSLIAWAINDSSSRAPTPQFSAFQDSLKVLDPNRPFLVDIEAKAITNFPFAAPKLEPLTAENLLELKKKYQPVSLKISKDSSISVFNMQDFAALDKVALQWKITDGEKVVLQGEVNNLSIKPGKSQVVKLPFSFHTFRNENYSLSFKVKLKENILWAEKGFVLAWESFDTSALGLLFK